jgi:RNA polymerase sigma factor (TIGR02999 family)
MAEMPANSGEITQLLKAWGRGDSAALDRLTLLVYEELRRLARNYMRKEHPGHILQATALVNEAFLRLVDARQVDWQDRAHFFAVAARTMRRILVDTARTRQSLKRGGRALRVDHSTPVNLDRFPAVASSVASQLCALDDALTALARMDPRRAQVIELRYFGGLTVEETGHVLKISPQSVMRDWKLARAWLARELNR